MLIIIYYSKRVNHWTSSHWSSMSMDVNYKKIYSEQSVTNVKNHAILCIRIRNFALIRKLEILFAIFGLWILVCVYCRTVLWKRKRQIIGIFFFLIEFKVIFLNNFQMWLNNMGGSLNIRSCIWIRIRNKSFRIHNTA